jgi:hypothetical protein
MPDAKDNAKQTGDTHPPEVEDRPGSPQGRPLAQGTEETSDTSLGRDLDDEGRAGKGINQAGYLKDKEAPGAGDKDRT